MPESAEVRLIRNGFADRVVGKYLGEFNILGGQFLNKSKKPTCLEEFQNELPLKVLSAKTRGKFCWINFENNWTAMVTFGMSGNFRIDTSDPKSFKHNHIEIKYSQDIDSDTDKFQTIYYHDIRRFGTWNFVKTDGSELKLKLDNLGLEILTKAKLDYDTLVSKFKSKTKYKNWTIAGALMSQEILAGPGAYIVAESLYACQTHPNILIRNLTDNQLYQIYRKCRLVALTAYKNSGASLYTYTGISGDKSSYKDKLQIYGKNVDGEGHRVDKIKIKGGRTIQYVPHVQRL